jgi:hypothetical protein
MVGVVYKIASLFFLFRVFVLSRFRDNSTETTLCVPRVWLVADLEVLESVNGGDRENAKEKKTRRACVLPPAASGSPSSICASLHLRRRWARMMIVSAKTAGGKTDNR